MLKNILNLEGAQKLTKSEQQSINGGYIPIVKCGTNTYRMTESQCLSQVQYNPIYFPSTGTCSLIGPACND